MSAFDEMQRQLLDSVARRRRGDIRQQRGPAARRRRWIALIAIPLVFVAAAAAAKIVVQSGESPADTLMNRVLDGTGRSSACRTTGARKSRLSSEAPDPRITATLPALSRPPSEPPAAAVVRLAERNSGGAVLARTIRVVRFPDGLSLIEYVAHGQGPFTLVDPSRCEMARLALLARLRPGAHDRLREAVAHQIRLMSDTDPGTQSITLDRREQRPGAPLDGGGGSFPLLATDKTLPTGVLFSGSGCENARVGHPAYCSPVYYGGIVKRETAYLTLRPAVGFPSGSHAHGSSTRIAVREGLFLFALPRGAGHELLVQHALDGRPLAVSSVSWSAAPRERGGGEEAAGD